MSREAAIQEAYSALLLADPAVSAIVGEQIFDEVPAPEKLGGPKPPWIYLGPVNRRRLEAGCSPLSKVTMRIFAASTAFGRREAWALAEAIEAALEGAEPEITGATICEPCTCLQSGDVVSPADPKTVFVDVAITVS